jgi:hypothetical protein
MNVGNRFRRFGSSPRIDLGPLPTSDGDTNYAVTGRRRHRANQQAPFLSYSRFGVPFAAAQLHHTWKR